MTNQPTSWNKIVSKLPGAHFLQVSEWADIKRSIGWTREELVWTDVEDRIIGAAQLLIRSMRLLRIGPRISVGYIPRGPLTDWENKEDRTRVIKSLEKTAHKRGLVFLKIDPEVLIDAGLNVELPSSGRSAEVRLVDELRARGWKYSPEQIQFKNTMLLNLAGTEEDWLARMKQKTRYNLRLALKNGVTVRKARLDELPLLYQMYVETADRDGFIIRPESYYLEVWTKFINAAMAEALIAEFDGAVLAGLVFFYLGSRAWYVYGMSTNKLREKMPNYLLQWEAMRSAREKGCLVYDLWGAPDTLDASDPMFGVYRFKEGLGAELARTIGAWDYPVRPLLYFMYHRVIPGLLSITRQIRRKQIKQEVVV